MKLGKLQQMALASAIVGAGILGCSSKDVPNLGVYEMSFSKNGKEIKSQVIDVDNDLEVDGVLGEGYLLFYKEGYQTHPSFKKYYNSNKSLPLSKQGVEDLSNNLKKNNFKEYQKSLLEDYIQKGGI